MDVSPSSDLDDIRRDIVSSIVAMMLFVGWVALWAALHYRQLGYFLAASMLVAGALGSARLRKNHLRAALYGIILTLLGTIVCLEIFYPNSPAQYYFPLVVIVSGLLESNWGLLVVAAMASLACVSLARLQGASWLDNASVLTPNVLIYLTAFTTWLSARQLITALNWMRTAYTRAHDLLEQLRDERASMAATLKQLEDAYQRIEKMNHALMEARNAAEESRRLKAEFAANISHELRTPLNIIIGFSETMANAPETYPGVAWSPMLRGDVEQIYQSSRHLLSLIDDILDLSALDMHRLGLTFEETAIQTVIAEAVAVVHDLFQAKHLYLRVQVEPGLPMLRVDPTRIRQVLINLLTNASRFTATGGVTITAQLSGSAVQVAVADTGIGIALQDISKVFDEFGQVDSSLHRKHEGSGLGVPLSKRLIELHNGRLWLESQPGQGSTFYFELPTSGGWGAAPELARADGNAGALPGRKTVLMVEPDAVVLHMVRRHLSPCEVIEIGRQADLPGLIEQYRPVALIIDQPGEDESRWPPPLLKPVPPDLPVIIVQLPGQLRNAQALGIRNLLTKPVTRGQLLEAIDDLGQTVRSVLIVDDDPSLVELVSRMLQAEGGQYRLIKALGGAEALAQLRREPVDLVLLDWSMPEVNGLAVLQEMKTVPSLADIPVIVISGEYSEAATSSAGLDLRMIRSGQASVSEIVNYLEALVGVLPLAGIPDSEAARPSRATQADQPVS
jgi:signal transduction histidine kinase/CheY-like chemotaxis protein